MKLSSHEGFIRGNKSLSENKMRNNSFVKGKDSLPLIKNMSINWAFAWYFEIISREVEINCIEIICKEKMKLGYDEIYSCFHS